MTLMITPVASASACSARRILDPTTLLDSVSACERARTIDGSQHHVVHVDRFDRWSARAGGMADDACVGIVRSLLGAEGASDEALTRLSRQFARVDVACGPGSPEAVASHDGAQGTLTIRCVDCSKLDLVRACVQHSMRWMCRSVVTSWRAAEQWRWLVRPAKRASEGLGPRFLRRPSARSVPLHQ